MVNSKAFHTYLDFVTTFDKQKFASCHEHNPRQQVKTASAMCPPRLVNDMFVLFKQPPEQGSLMLLRMWQHAALSVP